MEVFELKEILKSYNIRPNDVLGQNFLVDEEVVKRIIASADIEPGDVVLEVGPGLGVITRALLEVGAVVVAVEKDKKFQPILQNLAKEFPYKLQIIWGDALKEVTDYGLFALSADRRITDLKSAPYKIVGNIPFYITGKLVRNIFDLSILPKSITFLVQKEVAERLVALPGQMSLVSIASQLKSDVSLEMVVSAKSFFPQPKVESAVVKFQISVLKSGDKFQITEEEEKKLFKLAKAAFLGKRKTLLNSLSSNLGLSKDRVGTVLAKLNIDPNTRPQALSLSEWIGLTKAWDL